MSASSARTATKLLHLYPCSSRPLRHIWRKSEYFQRNSATYRGVFLKVFVINRVLNVPFHQISYNHSTPHHIIKNHINVTQHILNALLQIVFSARITATRVILEHAPQSHAGPFSETINPHRCHTHWLHLCYDGMIPFQFYALFTKCFGWQNNKQGIVASSHSIQSERKHSE